MMNIYFYFLLMLIAVPAVTTCGVITAIQDNPYSRAANEAEVQARQDVTDAKILAECYIEKYLNCVDEAIAEYDFCKPSPIISETCSIKAEEVCK